MQRPSFARADVDLRHVPQRRVFACHAPWSMRAGGRRMTFLASARTAMARIGRNSLASSHDPKAHARQHHNGQRI
jgi:hypothetical protein